MAKRAPYLAAKPSTMASLRPRFSTVSIMPGMDTWGWGAGWRRGLGLVS